MVKKNIKYFEDFGRTDLGWPWTDRKNVTHCIPHDYHLHIKWFLCDFLHKLSNVDPWLWSWSGAVRLLRHSHLRGQPDVDLEFLNLMAAFWSPVKMAIFLCGSNYWVQLVSRRQIIASWPQRHRKKHPSGTLSLNASSKVIPCSIGFRRKISTWPWKILKDVVTSWWPHCVPDPKAPSKSPQIISNILKLISNCDLLRGSGYSVTGYM